MTKRPENKGVTRQLGISFSIAFLSLFNRPGGRTSNVANKKMRFLLIALLGCMSLHASQLRLTFLHLPVYFNSASDPQLTELSVPFVTSYANPEALLGAMSLPYRPHHDTSWKTQEDINLISVYGFQLTFAPIPDSKDYRMTIDASKAKVPDGYPFSVQNVLEKIKACAPKNYAANNDSKLIIEIVGLDEPPKS